MIIAFSRILMQHLYLILFGVLSLTAITVLDAREVKLNGEMHTDLASIAGQMGMKFRWVERGKKAECGSKWTTLSFEIHKREFYLNGYKVYLGRPVAAYKGNLYISKLDYEKTIKPLLIPQQSGATPPLRHIIIDPGHGGKDPGAQNRAMGIVEKELTLDVARRLKRQLEEEGFKVSLTRSVDEFISLSHRPARANSARADLFISIHFNSTASSRVKGVETYILTQAGHPSTSRSKKRASDSKSYSGNRMDAWNALCGFYVQKSLVSSLGVSDRGLKRARFAVLKSLKCPGILIEGGFVTHPSEAGKLKNTKYRENMARSITEGVLLYQKTLNRLKK